MLTDKLVKSDETETCSEHLEGVEGMHHNECIRLRSEDCSPDHSAHEAISAPSMAGFEPQSKMCPEHNEYPLGLFCNDCIEICCLKCIWEGRHKEHNTIPLEKSKDFIKTSLETNVTIIENDLPLLQNIAQQAMEKVNKTQSAKEQVRETVRKCFNLVRTALDEKEKELLYEIEGAQLGEDDLSQYISNTQSALYDLPSTVTAGKALLGRWNSSIIALDDIHIATSIAESVKKISSIKSSFNKLYQYETVIDSNNFKNEIKDIIQSLNALKGVDSKRISVIEPKGLRINAVGPFSVAFEWDEDDLDTDKYIVAMQKEGEMWDPNSSIECTDNRITLVTLEPDTLYKFSVRAKRGTIISKWSDALTVKTLSVTVENITTTLKEHCCDVEACIKSLEYMSALTKMFDNKVKAETIEAILNVMKTHINNADVCKQGCISLWKITANNSNNQVKAGKFGAIEVILDAIKIHINNADVCEEGCGALWNITVNADNKVKAGQLGATEVILNAMKTHIDNVGVCEKGCVGLWNIMSNASSNNKAGQLEAIKVILDAMKAHIDNVGVCEKGCATLYSVTTDADNQDAVGELGAVEVVLIAMRAHIGKANVCHFGCGALKNITHNNRKSTTTTNNIIRAGQSGAVDFIVNAMKTHINSAGVCENCCNTLYNITVNDDNIVKLKKLNINEVFVVIQSIHPSLSDIIKTIIERVNKTKILFGLFG